jgi:hypothetical protein
MKEDYPFKPKSTASLLRGQYWAIPLSNNKYCCGIVLHLLKSNNKKEQRTFHAGLLNWVGNNPPTENEIKACKVLENGAAHIKTIIEVGSEITGKINLALEEETIEYTDEIHTWGYNYINKLGEKYFVKNS